MELGEKKNIDNVCVTNDSYVMFTDGEILALGHARTVFAPLSLPTVDEHATSVHAR